MTEASDRSASIAPATAMSMARQAARGRSRSWATTRCSEVRRGGINMKDGSPTIVTRADQPSIRIGLRFPFAMVRDDEPPLDYSLP